MVPSPSRPPHRAHRAGRPATALILIVPLLAACSGTTASTPRPDVEPQEESAVRVITGGGGSYTDADGAVTVDGTALDTGEPQCAKALDESTDDPTIRLSMRDTEGRTGVDIVLTDASAPTVVSAVVLRPDAAPLTGAEGLDGSTLAATRDGATFSVRGAVTDAADGSSHELALTSTCAGL